MVLTLSAMGTRVAGAPPHDTTTSTDDSRVWATALRKLRCEGGQRHAVERAVKHGNGYAPYGPMAVGASCTDQLRRLSSDTSRQACRSSMRRATHSTSTVTFLTCATVTGVAKDTSPQRARDPRTGVGIQPWRRAVPLTSHDLTASSPAEGAPTILNAACGARKARR